MQKAQGIKDSRELFIADCLKDGLGLNHVELLSKIVDRCNDTIKFVEDCGAEFVPNHMLFEGGHSVPRSYEIKAGTGSGYIHPMYDQIKKLSNVTVKTRAKFDDFIMDGDAVVGVTYREGYRFNAKLQSDDLENKTGKTKTVRAKLGVMLAARRLLPRHLVPSDSGPARCSDHGLHEPARRHGRRARQVSRHRCCSGPALLAAVPPLHQPA